MKPVISTAELGADTESDASGVADGAVLASDDAVGENAGLGFGSTTGEKAALASADDKADGEGVVAAVQPASSARDASPTAIRLIA